MFSLAREGGPTEKKKHACELNRSAKIVICIVDQITNV